MNCKTVSKEETSAELRRLEKDPKIKKQRDEFERNYEFRKNLVSARGSMTQKELCRRSGLSQQAISRLEKSGKGTLSTLQKYADGLGGVIKIDLSK
jgi:predicted transcriptional regulator